MPQMHHRPVPQPPQRPMPSAVPRQQQRPSQVANQQERARIQTAKDQDTARLVSMGQMFIQASVPNSNVVLEQDFSKFIPLFNRASIKDMNEDMVNDLSNEYNGRFSLRHPIHIVSSGSVDKTSPGAMYYEPDKKYHRVLFTIPPKFKPLHTLNELGSKFTALMNAFFNSATTDNPLDHRNEMYGKQIAEAMRRANPESEKEAYMKQVLAAESNLQAMKSGKPSQQAPSQQPDTKTQETAESMGDLEIDW